MAQMLQCVPNFSEGRNEAAIQAIANAIASVPGIRLLEVDSGAGANRSVMTFAGEPDRVVEAAFRAIRTAQERIDMRLHYGEHPRIGATDVCPLIPLEGLTVEEANDYAKALAERVGKELEIPVYLYGHSAQRPERASLAYLRKGGYEGLDERVGNKQWTPDHGPDAFNARSGATVIGVRDLLVAYNINLNTTSTELATRIARQVRESGYWADGPNGQRVKRPGLLQHVRALGWYIEEYGCAQVSLNLTHYQETPMHKVFETIESLARDLGLRVTGSELVGLVPKEALVMAGKYFLKKQGRSWGLADDELIAHAVKGLGLHELRPFEPAQKVLEFALQPRMARIGDLPIQEFNQRVASLTDDLGGGSVTAMVGAMGVALAAGMANIAAERLGRQHLQLYSELAENMQETIVSLQQESDHEHEIFRKLHSVLYLHHKPSPAEQARINEAAEQAAQLYMAIIHKSIDIYPTLRRLLAQATPDFTANLGVAAHCLSACINSAILKLESYLSLADDQAFTGGVRMELHQLKQDTQLMHGQILDALKQEEETNPIKA